MQPRWLAGVTLVGLGLFGTSPVDDPKLKFADCPEAVRKSLQAEAFGAPIETVTREKDDLEAVYWAEAVIDGKAYAIGVLQDGTLAEINLAVDGDDQIAIENSPAAVQATFGAEAFGEKISKLGKDLKYGVTIYEATVAHKGKSYEVVVAEDGTLVEKVLVIDDDEIELSHCPQPVQAILKKHARGGTIDGITRSSGIGKKTYEAEVEIRGKVYTVEVDELGSLIAKSLQAVQE